MRKIVVIVYVVVLVVIGACLGNPDPRIVPLTHFEDYSGFVTTNYLKTNEGIVICCSDDYVLSNDGGGQFLFAVKDPFNPSDEKLEITSSWGIDSIMTIDYEGNMSTETCNNHVAIVDNSIYEFTVFIDRFGTEYSAHFIRSGM